jgi:hypothetical protein
MKVAVIIPALCPPYVLKLTVGTLLRTHSRHDLNIHIGMHSNYRDYCADLSVFEDLRKVAQFHLVDEISWVEHNANLNRYSLMHSKNLENLLHHVRYYDFDYVLVLDHDLMFKEDLVTKLVEAYPDADLLGALFDDTMEMKGFRHSGDGVEMQRMPRMTPWCLLLSRKLYDTLLKDLTVIRPMEDHWESGIKKIAEMYGSSMKMPVFGDTFARVLHLCLHEWKMRLGVATVAKMEEWVHHFFGGSLNYGQWALREKYVPHLGTIEQAYKTTFPNGIKKLTG